MVTIYGGSGGGGFDYVQDPSPQDPSEGEEWYDTGSDSAFVYTGSAWVEQTITSHDKLSGVTSDQHHTRPTGTGSAGTTSGFFGFGSATVSPGGYGTYSETFDLRQTADALRLSNVSAEWPARVDGWAVYVNGSQKASGSGMLTGQTIDLSDQYVHTWTLEITCIDDGGDGWSPVTVGNVELSVLAVVGHSHTI